MVNRFKFVVQEIQHLTQQVIITQRITVTNK